MQLRTLSLPSSESLAKGSVKGLPTDLTSEAESLTRKLMSQAESQSEQMVSRMKQKAKQDEAILNRGIIGPDDSNLQQQLFNFDVQANQQILGETQQTAQGYQSMFDLNINELFGIGGGN